MRRTGPSRHTIGVRDSKNVDPILEFAPATLATFIAKTKAGDFTHLT